MDSIPVYCGIFGFALIAGVVVADVVQCFAFNRGWLYDWLDKDFY